MPAGATRAPDPRRTVHPPFMGTALARNSIGRRPIVSMNALDRPESPADIGEARVLPLSEDSENSGCRNCEASGCASRGVCARLRYDGYATYSTFADSLFRWDRALEAGRTRISSPPKVRGRAWSVAATARPVVAAWLSRTPTSARNVSRAPATDSDSVASGGSTHGSEDSVAVVDTGGLRC